METYINYSVIFLDIHRGDKKKQKKKKQHICSIHLTKTLKPYLDLCFYQTT